MATYTNTYLLIQPSNQATQQGTNNHRRLFVDSTGRYWYLTFTQDTLTTPDSNVETVDVFYADDPLGVWTKETLRVTAEFGDASGLNLNGCFAEADNGDIVLFMSMTASVSTDYWRVYRRTGDDATPAWVEQARPVPAYTANEAVLMTTNFFIFQHPDDSNVWIIIHADKNPALPIPSNLSYMTSSDNMTSWDAPIVLDAAANGSTISGRNGLCVATGYQGRTLYVFYANDNQMYFARLTNWDTAPAFSAPVLINSGAPSVENYAVSGGWKADGTFDVLYDRYAGTFSNFIVRHRNISNVDGVAVVGAETQVQNIGTQFGGPFGAYVDADDKYNFWWNNSPEQGFFFSEGGASEAVYAAAQTTAVMSSAGNLALDRDLAGSSAPGSLLRGTFLITYGLHEDGVRRAYSIVTSDTLELVPPLTTPAPTTPAPTTLISTTFPYTGPPTSPPIDLAAGIVAGITFRRGLRECFARATIVDASGDLAGTPLSPALCSAELFSESGSLGLVAGRNDPGGEMFVQFRIPSVVPVQSHVYVLRVKLFRADGSPFGTRDFPLSTS